MLDALENLIGAPVENLRGFPNGLAEDVAPRAESPVGDHRNRLGLFPGDRIRVCPHDIESAGILVDLVDLEKHHERRMVGIDGSHMVIANLKLVEPFRAEFVIDVPCKNRRMILERLYMIVDPCVLRLVIDDFFRTCRAAEQDILNRIDHLLAGGVESVQLFARHVAVAHHGIERTVYDILKHLIRIPGYIYRHRIERLAVHEKPVVPVDADLPVGHLLHTVERKLPALNHLAVHIRELQGYFRHA